MYVPIYIYIYTALCIYVSTCVQLFQTLPDVHKIYASWISNAKYIPTTSHIHFKCQAAPTYTLKPEIPKHIRE